MADKKKKAKRPKGKALKPPGKGVSSRKGQPLKISEEERQRRSEAMKKRHEEGRAGAAFGHLGGRPRKKRASEVIAEGASDLGKEMLAVLKDAMDEKNPASVRMKAVESLVKIENSEARLGMDEEEHLKNMSRDDLIAHLVKQFGSNPMVMEMFRQAASAPPPVSPPNGDGKVLEGSVADDD